jgi:hypothetical protein
MAGARPRGRVCRPEPRRGARLPAAPHPPRRAAAARRHTQARDPAARRPPQGGAAGVSARSAGARCRARPGARSGHAARSARGALWQPAPPSRAEPVRAGPIAASLPRARSRTWGVRRPGPPPLAPSCMALSARVRAHCGCAWRSRPVLLEQWAAGTARRGRKGLGPQAKGGPRIRRQPRNLRPRGLAGLLSAHAARGGGRRGAGGEIAPRRRVAPSSAGRFPRRPPLAVRGGAAAGRCALARVRRQGGRGRTLGRQAAGPARGAAGGGSPPWPGERRGPCAARHLTPARPRPLPGD